MEQTCTPLSLRESLKMLTEKSIFADDNYVLETIRINHGLSPVVMSNTIQVAKKNGGKIEMDHLVQQVTPAVASTTVLRSDVKENEFTFFLQRDGLYASIIATYTNPEKERVYISFA